MKFGDLVEVKYIPPDIKHNRIPAPTIRFTALNLPFRIQEVEALRNAAASSTAGYWETVRVPRGGNAHRR